MLEFCNTKLAVVEAKAWDVELTEGVAQAKNYAAKLAVRFAFAGNGQCIYRIDMQTGEEGEVYRYPSPEELWSATFAEQDAWRDRFAAGYPSRPRRECTGPHQHAFQRQATGLSRFRPSTLHHSRR